MNPGKLHFTACRFGSWLVCEDTWRSIGDTPGRFGRLIVARIRLTGITGADYEVVPESHPHQVEPGFFPSLPEARGAILADYFGDERRRAA